MLKLSVIIVNYNVKYFLEQALHATIKALQNISGEIIVVDNNSTDGSVELVREKFPSVTLIANKKNTGFSVANNQGIKIATGEYILLLNPDTVVAEDTFEQCLQFMDSHPQAGALGVKMIDGKGNFLPESKRSLPTPSVSFFKIFGFSAFFPKSKVFGRYHLGFLPENEINEVDVLPGAFMLLRNETLQKIGLLDETFFMYGEDIDLSFRVQLGGYKNYYFPNTTIIHYKGESTKKGSLNYVRIFYQAMIIFAKKHFSSQYARYYALFINIAVWLRAIIAVAGRWMGQLTMPLADAGLLLGGMLLIKNFWATNIKNASEYYPPVYMHYVVPSYILIWLLVLFFNGGYDRPLRTYRTVRGIISGTLLIAAIYAFLPETLRFSRAMILAGGIWATFALVGLRYIWGIVKGQRLLFGEEETPRIMIVGGIAETRKALALLTQAGVENSFIGFVSNMQSDKMEENYLGNLDELAKCKQLYHIDEVIFCANDISNQFIITNIQLLGTAINYKILPPNSTSIIGSNSKNTAGDLYAIDINLAIGNSMNRRNKRLIELVVCLKALVLFPLFLLVMKNRLGFVKNWYAVLVGNKNWVGYALSKEYQTKYLLPKLKPGVLTPLDEFNKINIDAATSNRLNLLYAKDYTVYKDIKLLLFNWRNMGRQL